MTTVARTAYIASVARTACIASVATQGTVPPVQQALELYDVLSKSDTDLRLPVGLEQQLLKDNDLDTEVGQSMLQLLRVRLQAAMTAMHCIVKLWNSQGVLAKN